MFPFGDLKAYVGLNILESMASPLDTRFGSFHLDKVGYYARMSIVSNNLSDECENYTNFKSLFDALCNIDPALRPEIADIICHPWLRDDVASPEEVAAAFVAVNT